jgi:hypothetical protein
MILKENVNKTLYIYIYEDNSYINCNLIFFFLNINKNIGGILENPTGALALLCHPSLLPFF